MKTELRLTDTNAASDSQGRTWGLEGNLFWFLVGGVGAGITLFFLLIVAVKAGLLLSFGIAVVPVLLALAYIYGFRQGKPPGYDRDCFEYWLTGAGFAPHDSNIKHPFGK
jgi:Flp pilus assembly protein TadB